jgi:hypothetical protein
MISHASKLGNTVLLGFPTSKILKEDHESAFLLLLFGHITSQDLFESNYQWGSVLYRNIWKRLAHKWLHNGTKNGMVGTIIELAFVAEMSSAIALYKLYDVLQKQSLKGCVYSSVKHFLITICTDTIIAIKCEDTMQKCICLGSCGNANKNFVLLVLQPNVFEVD